MTTMNANHQPGVPDPNNPKSIESHKSQVLETFASIFDLIDQALRDSAPKATSVFALLEGPVDLSVHAGLTRYLCKRFLESRNVDAEEESSPEFEVEKVSNCGLCLNQGPCQIRILKAASYGIPKATSEARRRFYSSNQYVLPFALTAAQNSSATIPLSLVVLWNLDEDFNFERIEIACPRRERTDGTVDCFWIAPWFRQEALLEPCAELSESSSDLEEIKPVEKRKKATS